MPGNYSVTETLLPNFINVTNLTQNVTLTCVNLTGVNFRNLQFRTLSGRKIDDCTGLGLNGWTIIVYNATTNTTITTTTSTISGIVGSWRVQNLPPGDYQVREVLNDNWMNVTPISLNVTIPRCGNKANVNFHNRPLKCVSGYKLDACNGTGIAGWQITLNNSSFTDTRTTDINGKYEFCRLAPGTYNLTEALQPDWIKISAPTAVTINCTNITNQNFTNQKLLCISGYKKDACNSSRNRRLADNPEQQQLQQ